MENKNWWNSQMEDDWKRDALQQVMQALSRADKALKPPFERHVYWCLWQTTLSLAKSSSGMHEPYPQTPAWISHWTICARWVGHLSDSSHEPGWRSWPSFRDLALPLNPLKNFQCVHMRGQAGSVPEMSGTCNRDLGKRTGTLCQLNTLARLRDERIISHLW